MTNSLYVLAERVVRDGKVAVLYSPGYGAGWSSWADFDLAQKLIFDPEIVAWVENGKEGEYPDLERKYGVIAEGFHDGGAIDLRICWVPLGVKFLIYEYDGYESVILENEENWITA